MKKYSKPSIDVLDTEMEMNYLLSASGEYFNLDDGGSTSGSGVSEADGKRRKGLGEDYSEGWDIDLW